jgi:hypothetical protein
MRAAISAAGPHRPDGARPCHFSRRRAGLQRAWASGGWVQPLAPAQAARFGVRQQAHVAGLAWRQGLARDRVTVGARPAWPPVLLVLEPPWVERPVGAGALASRQVGGHLPRSFTGCHCGGRWWGGRNLGHGYLGFDSLGFGCLGFGGAPIRCGRQRLWASALFRRLRGRCCRQGWLRCGRHGWWRQGRWRCIPGRQRLRTSERFRRLRGRCCWQGWLRCRRHRRRTQGR